METKPEARQAAGTSGAAEALLRRHGIALLPADDGSTVLSALQSGRTVVLSDAGKLMLKESGGAGAAAAGAGGGAGASGVVLAAKTVAAPAGAGLKVFALNGLPGAPRKRIINPQDLQQLKIVQLPGDGKLVSAATAAPPKDKRKPAQRPPVKILMKKSNFERLIATANKTGLVGGAQSVAAGGAAEAAAGAACGACGCSARLAAAQRALLRLAAELRDARARLAAYEPAAP